jgi:hypothetical protein
LHDFRAVFRDLGHDSDSEPGRGSGAMAAAGSRPKRLDVQRCVQ